MNTRKEHFALFSQRGSTVHKIEQGRDYGNKLMHVVQTNYENECKSKGANAIKLKQKQDNKNNNELL